MLAVNADDINELTYPLYGSFKLDGIRCYCAALVPPPGDSCVPLTRTLKILPNAHVRDKLAKLPPGFDGELMCVGGFQAVQSAFMTRHGFPEFTYNVFDWVPDSWERAPYCERLLRLQDMCIRALKEEHHFVRFLNQRTLHNPDEVHAMTQEAWTEGHEGLILRSMHGHYKFGRSTLRERLLLKVKQFEDAEAEVIGFEELVRNENEPERNALGYQERSSHKENMVPGGTLGALKVRDHAGVEFCIGTGFTQTQRDLIWAERNNHMGRIVKYRHQPHGRLHLPRIPTFLGFRDREDMSYE
jgi:DNA ligase-1